jgi:hypothetical protein
MPQQSDGSAAGPGEDDNDVGWENLWCDEENTFHTNPVKVPSVVPGLWVGDFPKSTGKAPPSNAPLPDGWTKHMSKSKNRHYFFHKETGTTQWDFPKPKAKLAKPIPALGDTIG